MLLFSSLFLSCPPTSCILYFAPLQHITKDTVYRKRKCIYRETDSVGELGYVHCTTVCTHSTPDITTDYICLLKGADNSSVIAWPSMLWPCLESTCCVLHTLCAEKCVCCGHMWISRPLDSGRRLCDSDLIPMNCRRAGRRSGYHVIPRGTHTVHDMLYGWGLLPRRCVSSQMKTGTGITSCLSPPTYGFRICPLFRCLG